jgi:hypothetical protein
MGSIYKTGNNKTGEYSKKGSQVHLLFVVLGKGLMVLVVLGRGLMVLVPGFSCLMYRSGGSFSACLDCNTFWH